MACKNSRYLQWQGEVSQGRSALWRNSSSGANTLDFLMKNCPEFDFCDTSYFKQCCMISIKIAVFHQKAKIGADRCAVHQNFKQTASVSRVRLIYDTRRLGASSQTVDGLNAQVSLFKYIPNIHYSAEEQNFFFTVTLHTFISFLFLC